MLRIMPLITAQTQNIIVGTSAGDNSVKPEFFKKVILVLNVEIGL